MSQPRTCGPRTTRSGTNWKMVRWVAGTSGQRAPAHEQGHVARGRLLARGEAEDSFLHFPNLDAVLPQHPAGGGEELAGREGLGELEGDEVALLPQARRDHEGHAELLAEDLVDEGNEGHVVEAHPDRVAGEVRSETVRDALGHRALDDDPGGPGRACTGAGRLGGQRRRLYLRRPRTQTWAAGSDPERERSAGWRTRS